MAKGDVAGRGLLTLVLGGARSGKSRYAESLIKALPRPWFYVATAEAKDEEMTARIAEHMARRGAGWQTIEAPHDLAGALGKVPARAPVLIDCLTLWLSERMLAEADMDREIDALEAALTRRTGAIVAVSNEVGLSIVPDNALARRFRDLQGILNQRLAAQAARVVMMVAGIPIAVKSP
jgi:adenosylcobinamide kinase / adenosylcobinamide-phosphate guanylyltransferase